MRRIIVRTAIAARVERCFDLARSVDAHLRSAAGTGERVVGGRTSGLLELGDEVTWEAVHFGVRQRLTSRITAFDRPRHFRDEMIRGVFRRFVHDHQFEAAAGGTVMTDVVAFTAPLGVLGRVAERWPVGPHLQRFLQRRGEALKALAESNEGATVTY